MATIPPQLTWQNIIATLALLVTMAVAGWRLMQTQIDAVTKDIELLRAVTDARIGRLEQDAVRRGEFIQFEKRIFEH